MKRPIYLPNSVISPPFPNRDTEHHSVSDWDFTPGAVYTLDTAQYVSSPRSLRIGGAGGSDDNTIFLCRITATLNLPQGRLVTYHRSQTGMLSKSFPFRNQAALGSASQANMYQVVITVGEWQFTKRVGGVLTIIATQALTTNPNVWVRDRVTWWNGVTPLNVPALSVMLERYVGDAWVQQGDWVYDEANLWKDSSINRCGIGAWEDIYYYSWLDDTEIWAPS